MTPAAVVQSSTGTTTTTNQNRRANAIPANETSGEAPILRAIFKKFPLEIQLDYARHHNLPNAGKLTPEEICGSLFNGRDSIQALEVPDHIHYPTREGLFIVKDVMDLIDWLVEHTPMRIQTPDEDMEDDQIAIPPQQDHLDAITPGSRDRLLPTAEDSLEKMAGELELAQGHVKAAIEESQRATREACADVFILQGQLAQANDCHAEIVQALTDIVGLEAIQQIADKVDIATREGDLHTKKDQVEKLHSRALTPHILAGAQHAADKHNAPGLSSHQGTRSNTPHMRLGMKRVRDDVDDKQASPHPASSSLTSPLEDSHRRHKRLRLAKSSAVADTTPARTILNYSSDEGSEGDSSYSDSNGSERDFLDDHYSFTDFRGRPPQYELCSYLVPDRSDSSEDDGTSEKDKYLEWNSDDENCFSDPDYQPPEWDLEDIFELEKKTPQNSYHPLFRSRYIDELIENGGFLSDGGLSTEDSEKGTWTREMLQRRPSSTRSFPLSLYSLLSNPTDRDDWKYDRWGQLHDEETHQVIRKSRIAQEKWESWLSIQNRIENSQKYFPEWMELDVEKRLDEILSSDHAHFYIDDEEWKYFEDPSCWGSSWF